MELIPAIMPKTYADIETQVAQVRGLISTVQVDIMDGIFVPEKSWPFREGGEVFHNLVHGKMTLPYFDDVKYSADLMMVNSKLRVMDWIDAGFSEIIVHIGSTNEVTDIIEICRKNKARVGIALKTTTPNTAVEPWISAVDFVQCMGIAQIGYQGQPFDERVIPKIKDLRAKYPNAIIQVDGGVSLETTSMLMDAGANRLVAGSAIWKSKSTKDAIKDLQRTYL